MTLPPSGFSEVSYSENVSVRRGSIMKRLAGTVLGLLFAQVCCELGLPHRGSERMRHCSIVGGWRGADKSCRLFILLIIYGDAEGTFRV